MDSSRLSIRSVSPYVAVAHIDATERDPLLGSSPSPVQTERVKSWYRPRPLWLVPFAITAALCRSMTLAPRTEVFTKLACEKMRSSRHHHTSSLHHHVRYPSLTQRNHSLFSPGFPVFLDSVYVLSFLDTIVPPAADSTLHLNNNEENLPSVGNLPIECFTDPVVQADAAKLQTIMTTTMGVLSAFTTGWWGQFGDHHGRNKVLASAVTGLLFTDIMFILASDPPEVLGGHARSLLVVAPVIEGLLGGWSTLQGATYAYISDCTSHGSRVHIFSRFTGVFYVGFALGPEIAALILRKTHIPALVFYTSAICASVNLLLLVFVFPESVSKDLRAFNVAASHEARLKASEDVHGKPGLWLFTKNAVISFLKPMKILGPQPRAQGRGQDWSVTMITTVLFCYFLSMGMFQIKYLYAEHVFSWDAEKLSYYITAVGSARALHLLLVLPFAIRLLKGAPARSKVAAKKPSVKATPSQATLSSEIKFDLIIGKISLGIDLLSHSLVALAPGTSQALFVGLTTITSFGAGLVPALQSVAMSVMLLRGDRSQDGGTEVGKLFGAFAVLQAIGSTILGPMLFGTVYSLTVARYPKAIFVLGAGLLVVASALLLLIRRPRPEVPIQIRVETQVEVAVERVRGRSRKSKDISAGLQ